MTEPINEIYFHSTKFRNKSMNHRGKLFIHTSIKK